jgi:hypothetical protein
VYELYAVLNHSGAISGGHYYAYIKNLDTKKWYNFNDSNVTEISEDKVCEAWGGQKAGFTGTSIYASSFNNANGYMLMYRKLQHSGASAVLVEKKNVTDEDNFQAVQTKKKIKINKNKNKIINSRTFPEDIEIPVYIHEDIKKIQIEISRKEKIANDLKNKLNLKIYYNDIEYTFDINKQNNIKYLLQNIWIKFLYYKKEFSYLKMIDDSEVTNNEKYDINMKNKRIEIKDTDHNDDLDSGDDLLMTVEIPYDLFRLRYYNTISKVFTDVFDISTGRYVDMHICICIYIYLYVHTYTYVSINIC